MNMLILEMNAPFLIWLLMLFR